MLIFENELLRGQNSSFLVREFCLYQNDIICAFINPGVEGMDVGGMIVVDIQNRNTHFSEEVFGILRGKLCARVPIASPL